jgi:hypothetical protein
MRERFQNPDLRLWAFSLKHHLLGVDVAALLGDSPSQRNFSSLSTYADGGPQVGCQNGPISLVCRRAACKTSGRGNGDGSAANSFGKIT